MKSFRTRPVEPAEEDIYWKRSEECWQLALQAGDQRKWSGCVINVIHAVIALVDLMCVRFAGKRYAGTSHDEAAKFYATLDVGDDVHFKQSIHRLSQVLSFKTHAEYGGEPLSEKQARLILKNVERLREYILGKLRR